MNTLTDSEARDLRVLAGVGHVRADLESSPQLESAACLLDAIVRDHAYSPPCDTEQPQTGFVDVRGTVGSPDRVVQGAVHSNEGVALMSCSHPNAPVDMPVPTEGIWVPDSPEDIYQLLVRRESIFDNTVNYEQWQAGTYPNLRKAFPLFNIVTGTPRAWCELPNNSGGVDRFTYVVLGWICAKPLAECQALLVGKLLGVLIAARRQLIGDGREAAEDNCLPWIIERRGIELSEEAPRPAGWDFNTGQWVSEVTTFRSKLTWRIAIPGVDLTLSAGYCQDGYPIQAIRL